MGLSFPKFRWPVWSRNAAGENFIDVKAIEEWTDSQNTFEVSQNHPILTPALLFVSKLFAQAKFEVVHEQTNNPRKEHALLSLLRKPNNYQTKEDFFETLLFMMISQGYAVVALNRIIGFDEPKSMFVLINSKIEWPKGFENKKFAGNNHSYKNEVIIYDRDGENKKYKIKDLLFFYDMPNCVGKNPLTSGSRLKGLMQTLVNTQDSLIAKNIILRSNGKELITGKKSGFPLSPEEKDEIERLFNSKLGLSITRKRGVVTKADLDWKSLHIALRDLGLDESVKVDGNLIYTALHIPKDILSLEAKKTTYNNFKESMVSYVQNEITPMLQRVCATFSQMIEDNYELRGNYDHLPIMQFIRLEKFTVVSKQAEALHKLRSSGVPDEIALELVDLPKGLELKPLSQMSTTQENNNQTSEEDDDEEE